MAEEDHRQARVIGSDAVLDGVDVGDDLGGAVLLREHAGRCVWRGGAAMAAMVVRVGVKAAEAEEIGKAGISRSMLRQTVIDLDHAARLALR